jgi:hypothetical protein
MEFTPPPFIGVVGASLFGEASRLKRMMLLFERLAIDISTRRLTAADMAALKNGRNDFEFLRSEGLLTTEMALAAEHATRTGSNEHAHTLNQFLPTTAANRVQAHLQLSGISSRVLAAQLRRSRNVDAVAVSDTLEGLALDERVDRDFVIRVSLTALPIPAENTPWEAILDFRRDPESKIKFARLKTWMNRVARTDLTHMEFIDEVHHLLTDYESHMRLHRMQTSKGFLEVLVTGTAEAVEDLAKLRFGKLAKAPFEINKQRFALLAEEREAPGTEIAYIVAARSRFSPALI